MQQRCPSLLLSPLPNYQEELKAAIWWCLGEAYKGKDNNKAIEWYEKALALLEQEIALSDAAAGRYFEIAYDLHIEKDYSGVIELLNRAIKLKQDDAFAYNNRGIAYENSSSMSRPLLIIPKPLLLTLSLPLPTSIAAAYNYGCVILHRLRWTSIGLINLMQRILMRPGCLYGLIWVSNVQR